LLKRDEYLAPATSQPERFDAHTVECSDGIRITGEHILLATGAATAQAQDGSERSWQYNAEFRAAQKELREKRLQKQQLEAQAQKTDRSKCAERKNGNG
jgi:PAB1-binding protein PBP1